MSAPGDTDSKAKSLYVATSRPRNKLVLMNVQDKLIKEPAQQMQDRIHIEERADAVNELAQQVIEECGE
jgi:hypothetical protein